MKKILTVYYSWSNGNTERIAKMLHKKIGGWPGNVILDIKAVCKGANIAYKMKIQFDSEGGSNLVTPMEQIEQWIQNVKCIL